MKVLFISSGNSKSGISPIVKNQGLSIEKEGVDVTYFTIKGKGLIGYLKNIKLLKKNIRDSNFDFIHAHYSMSAFVASLAGAKPLIVSLMGSDVKAKKYFKILIALFNRISWGKVIVKSQDMKDSINLKEVEVIPNGVNIDIFKPFSQTESKDELGWDKAKKQILFAANPNRYEKNFSLANEAFSLTNKKEYELKVLEDVPNELIPLYFNAADLVLLTSLWEGSPNVIKEALACNRPILSTNVGDVASLFEGVKGCSIVNHNAEDIAQKIIYSIENIHLSNGRERIKLLKLDSKSVATRIIQLYNKV